MAETAFPFCCMQARRVSLFILYSTRSLPPDILEHLLHSRAIATESNFTYNSCNEFDMFMVREFQYGAKVVYDFYEKYPLWSRGMKSNRNWTKADKWYLMLRVVKMVNVRVNFE